MLKTETPDTDPRCTYTQVAVLSPRNIHISVHAHIVPVGLVLGSTNLTLHVSYMYPRTWVWNYMHSFDTACHDDCVCVRVCAQPKSFEMMAHVFSVQIDHESASLPGRCSSDKQRKCTSDR
jgi:hypothetical protein